MLYKHSMVPDDFGKGIVIPLLKNVPSGPKKVIPLVQFQNTQTLTVNKLNIQR